MFRFECCVLIVCVGIWGQVSTKNMANLPENWKDFIDPEILAKSEKDDEFTRYDSDLPEGDILGLQTLQLEHAAANAVNGASFFWPNNTIPYEFSKKQNALMTSKEMQIILESMRLISLLSGNCVKFVERADEEDYVSFQKGLQCMSNIGRIGGKQAVVYSPACLKQHGDVQHELMHVLGFFHEHSRADRDQYVIIIWDNIAKSDKDQFAKHEDGNTYELPYDYESVMHYKHNAFAKDIMIPTVVPTSRKSKIGQNKALSPLDVVRIHRRFRCAIADPNILAGGASSDKDKEKRDDCPVAKSSQDDQRNCESGTDNDGNVETADTTEAFPRFSQEPMTSEQCGLQFTANCKPSRYTASSCATGQELAIDCGKLVTSAEIQQISAGISKSPMRAITVDLYDDEHITFDNFQAVRKQVVALFIRDCISSRTSQKLTTLGFSNLLHFWLVNCHGMEIKKTDFSQSNKIRAILFENTTIELLEQGTFTDLPSLRVLSLEFNMNPMAAFGTPTLEYMKKLHCGCEFHWFRDWWENNPQLLRKAAEGEVYSIPQSWMNSAYSKENIYLPIDCSVNPFPGAPDSIDYSRYRFSINVPDCTTSHNDNEKRNDSPVTKSSKEDQCDCESSMDNDENKDAVSTSEIFLQFSQEPMAAEQCGLQFTANCNVPGYTTDNCTTTQALTINCGKHITSTEIRQISAGISKSPMRAIEVYLYDGEHIIFRNFQTVRLQVVFLGIRNCTSSRTAQKLNELRFTSLMNFQLESCYGLEIRKADFSYSNKIRAITFFNTTIEILEKGTFTDLPYLRLLALEYGMHQMEVFERPIRNYLKELHCGCEFQWFRDWWESNRQLLRKAASGEVFFIPDSWRSGVFTKQDIYLPIDCSVNPFPAVPASVDHKQYRFSINVPGFSGESQCSDKLTNSKDSFLAFSTDPMSDEECDSQFTANCKPTGHTQSECLVKKQVEINCNRKASSEEIGRMLTSINKAPLRPVRVVSSDDSELSSINLGEVGKQVADYNLINCTDERATGRLREMRMPNLLEYNLHRCLNLHAKKGDFEYSPKLRMVAFWNSTFRTIESDTFSQLPALRILSLEAEIRKAVTFNADIKDYLFRLHCSCDFAPFRKWRKDNKQLLRAAEKGQVYWFQESYYSWQCQSSDVFLPIDCSADPFPSGPSSINFSQVEFSLNEPAC
ncbi:uncharacterized protein LOC129601461 isoform X2 [Paramacrobiotus metropolitanus]|uniref:uncharacterized protein LOC129601461 isoform X2 n=1 Tax=Paramacrobiotus metropolitanus TaxID=2943436 RepID=UPI002445F7B5|nr:uncharacterized protein LOC129601461 isoform X2 [Paramacrobiotus metropolitanus]